jgi:MoaD family protein
MERDGGKAYQTERFRCKKNCARMVSFCQSVEERKRMRVKVKTFSVIRDVLGKDVVEIDVDNPATVSEVFRVLLRTYGEPFREKIWDPETGEIAPFLIRLNDEMISSKHDIHQQIKEGDELAIIFPIGGG